MNALATQITVVPRNQEVATLARELGAAFRVGVDFQKRKMGLPIEEAVAKAEEPLPPEFEEKILSAPADQVHWRDLEDLARKDPELALRRWEEVKAEALDELQSGHRAARVMEGYNSHAWNRAQFLALREDLTQEWQPRNGMERQLIDTMAQALTAMFFWQEQLSLRASIEPMHEQRDIEERDAWNPPRVSEHQALEQAGAMVDRFNRMYLRTLRALRDLRRYGQAVIVQNAGQVNVGGQQVNVQGQLGG